MDLTVVYSKTAKGLRARSFLIGGLSSQLMKVLSHVDGTSKAETILFKYDEMTEQGLAAALIQLETEGYIKPVLSTRPNADEWSPATIFAPMEVEEVASVEEAEAQAAEQARLQAEYKAKINEEVRLQAERKAQEKEEQEYAKEKAQAEAKVKAQLEVERIAREAEETQKKADEQARAKAEEKARLEAERKAKIEQAALQKAELKAQEAAEQARTKAQAEAKEKARREIERIAQEAEAARKKSEQEAQAKAENEAKLEAERKAKAKEEARLQAELEAQKEAEQARTKAQAEVEEKARREIERIAQEAEAAREKVEAEEKTKAEEVRREAALKAKTDANLEAELTAKAEEDARLEAERKAIEGDEARLKIESKAKAEAEKIRAKVAEEKERARLDIARIVREAEEARKKSEAEAKEARLSAKQKEKAAVEQKKAEIEANAKAKLAIKLRAERKIKAEEDARLKAEIEAKAQADQNRTDAEVKEKARADAKLKASLAMQSFVTGAGEAQKNSDTEVNVEEAQLETGRETNAAASLKADIKAEVKAEQVRAKLEKADIKAEVKAEQVRAKLEADEKALAEEKEIARQEIARIGREAEQERQKHQAEATVSDDAIEVRWANPDDDDEDFEEEERIAGEVAKVVHEIKKKTKRVAEVEGRQEIIRTAQEEAELKAWSKAQSRTLVISKKLEKWTAVAKKVMLIYLPLVILLIISLLHLVNISPLVAPIERLASESLGTPVVIEEVRASLWPQPHMVLKNVAIGASAIQKIEAMRIVPVTSSLSQEIKVLKSIEIEGLKIEQENFEQALQWITGLSKAQHLKVEHIALNKIVLKIKDLELLPLVGKVTLTESRELKSIDLMSDNETLAMQITPQGSSFDIAFTGINWALPMNPKLVFSELKAKGTIKQSLLFFNQIEGAIYGGSLTGEAALDWSNQWSIAGSFYLINANLPEILNAFGSSVSVDGKFNLAGIFSCKSKLAAALTDAPEITANFAVQNGKINGVEMDRAVLSTSGQSLAGDSTRFDKFTGSVKIKNGSYHYGQLVLKSDQFYAQGHVDIQPNQDISGKINAILAAQSRRIQASFDLAGKVNNVRRQ